MINFFGKRGPCFEQHWNPPQSRVTEYLIWKHGMMCRQTLLSCTRYYIVFLLRNAPKSGKNMKVFEHRFNLRAEKRKVHPKSVRGFFDEKQPSQSFQVTHQLPHNHQGGLWVRYAPGRFNQMLVPGWKIWWDNQLTNQLKIASNLQHPNHSFNWLC